MVRKTAPSTLPMAKAREDFLRLVEHVEDYAIFLLDADGRIASWNVGAERIKGYRADEVIGQHLSRFYTPEDVAAGRPAHALDVARREGVYRDEGWRLRKDGSRFWASVMLTPLRDEGGRLRGFAKVTRDLTGRHEAEEQRLALAREQAARVEAEKANQIKDEFMAVLSHELRTPLNAIVGWAQVIRSSPGLPADQFQRGLDAIHRNAVVQAPIVGDLLQLSR